MTEDEMIAWHHLHNGHEFEQTLGDGEGQGSLACCSPWCRKESKTQLSPAPSLNYFTMKCVLNPLAKKCLICKNILHHPWGFYHDLQQ